jgi:hypothetical protein
MYYYFENDDLFLIGENASYLADSLSTLVYSHLEIMPFRTDIDSESVVFKRVTFMQSIWFLNWLDMYQVEKHPKYKSLNTSCQIRV